MKTRISMKGRQFYINDKPVYAELDTVKPDVHGMLMNMRMIQGVFDDRVNPRRFDRFGKIFNPEKNTDDLIASLDDWYAYGLRAITVGFQGGGPCFTTDSYTVENSPFSPDGRELDSAYAARMKRIIDAADARGMVVICSFFYGVQSRLLESDRAVMSATGTAAGWLRDNGLTNVIIEIANEHDVEAYKCHPVLYTDKGIVDLIDIARRESGGMPIGCSGTGGYFSKAIAEASDAIFIHGNDQTRGQLYNLIQKAKAVKPERPLIINEDSQSLGNMQTAMEEGVSWGYYNNMTKQEPPSDWGITEGEDRFFALRMAENLGIPVELPEPEERFYLQGLEKDMAQDGKRWIRLAALYPETVHRVDFYRNGEKVGAAYDEPFMLCAVGSNWIQRPYPETIQKGEVWKAAIHLTDGTVVEKEVQVQ